MEHSVLKKMAPSHHLTPSRAQGTEEEEAERMREPEGMSNTKEPRPSRYNRAGTREHTERDRCMHRSCTDLYQIKPVDKQSWTGKRLTGPHP